jgi:hypothetical protein
MKMKPMFKIASLVVFMNITMWLAPQRSNAQIVTVSFQVFYDDLSPYGSWVNNPQYGYVWYPNTGDDFMPYGTNGYWANTDFGWTWVSYYPWGWAPFHYGRWFYDPMYGNMWVPGDEWGPGWVTWRQSEGYYGWAPIGPGISLEMAYSNNYNVRSDQWRFVRNGDFGREHINNYYIDRSTNVTIIKNTTVINNNYVEGGRKVTYNAGPQRTDVEKRAGKSFVPVAIKDNAKHSENMGKGELTVFRPHVQKADTKAKEAPKKTVEMKDLKAPAQQNNDRKIEKVEPKQQQRTEPAKQVPTPQKQPMQPAKREPVQSQPKNQQHEPTPSQKQPVQPNKMEPQTPAKREPARQQGPQPANRPPAQPRQPNNNQPNKQIPQREKQQQPVSPPRPQPQPSEQPPRLNDNSQQKPDGGANRPPH